MKRTFMVGVPLLLFLCLFFPLNLNAAGFYVDLQDAKGMALGGAFIAQANNPSAVFYNPAGMTQLEGTQISLGSTLIMPTTEFDSDVTGHNTEVDDNTWYHPNFYITHKFNDHVWIGIGSFSNFDVGTEWSSNWEGRYNAYEAVIKTMTFNPNVGYKFNDKFSLAVGLQIQYLDVRMKKKIGIENLRDAVTLGLVNGGVPPAVASGVASKLVNDPSSDIKNELNGDNFGYGFNVAARFQPTDWLALGVSYRSEIRHHIGDGDVDNSHQDAMAAEIARVLSSNLGLPYSFVYQQYLQALNQNFPDTGGSTTLTLPQTVFLGAAVKPIKPLTVEVAGYWTGWSSWDDLTLHFDQPIGGPDNYTSNTEKDWDDVWGWRIGLEYLWKDWAFRVGYVHDESPIPDETLDFMVPADDRDLYNFGIGYSHGNFTIDGAYTYLVIDDRDVSANDNIHRPRGELHDGYAHMFSISLGYKF